MTEIWAVYYLEILQRCMEYCSAAGHCFHSRLDPLYLKSNHAKFQSIPMRNGSDMGCLEFEWCSTESASYLVSSDALLSSSPSLIWLFLAQLKL